MYLLESPFFKKSLAGANRLVLMSVPGKVHSSIHNNLFKLSCIISFSHTSVSLQHKFHDERAHGPHVPGPVRHAGAWSNARTNRPALCSLTAHRPCPATPGRGIGAPRPARTGVAEICSAACSETCETQWTACRDKL